MRVPVLYILASAWYCQVLFLFLASNRCVVVLLRIVVLICISLMTNAIDHLSMCLFAIHISSLVKFKSFAHF